MKKIFVLLLVAMLCGSIFSAIAQSRTITGTVRDASTEEVMIGVTVKIFGTTKGTVTDTDGRYSISASTGDLLEFSYIGYISQDVIVRGGSDVYNVWLHSYVLEIPTLGAMVLQLNRTGSILSSNQNYLVNQ
jgi:hypothetical protein